MRPTTSLFRKKNIKNGSRDTIHIFKNYFVTVFLVFSFNKNKLYPNGRQMVTSKEDNKDFEGGERRL